MWRQGDQEYAGICLDCMSDSCTNKWQGPCVFVDNVTVSVLSSVVQLVSRVDQSSWSGAVVTHEPRRQLLGADEWK